MILDRTEVIPGLQEARDVKTHDAAEYVGDGKENAHDLYREAHGIAEYCAEDDAEALAAGNDGEAVKGGDEEEGNCTLQVDRVDEYAEDNARYGGEGQFEECV